MNLQTAVEPRLWEAIRASLEAKRFTGAILDAIHLLSEVIRERSGLEGDGASLIGAAFGGSAPKLKVNRLQTESEQNVQRGIESLLRGVYQALRNPRSHGPHQDDEKDATAIVLFLDYLLRVVDRSRSPFSLQVFVARLLDPDFVPKERYAELLVAEIPENKRLAVCREVFGRRAEADAQKLRFFFERILGVMSAEDKAELLEMLSEELAQTDDEGAIRFVLAVLPADSWPALREIARLRVENKLVRSVKEGKWLCQLNRCKGGSLGTWATNIIGQFTLKEDLWSAVFTKLRSADATEQDYVFKYFLSYAASSFESPPPALVWAVNQGLKAGDVRFKEEVERWQIGDWEERPPEHPWRKPFAEALSKFAPVEASAAPSDDDIPF